MDDDNKKFTGLGFYTPEKGDGSGSESSPDQHKVILDKIKQIAQTVSSQDILSNMSSEQIGAIISEVQQISADLGDESKVIDLDAVDGQLDQILEKLHTKSDVDEWEALDENVPGEAVDAPVEVSPTSVDSLDEPIPDDILARVGTMENKMRSLYEAKKAELIGQRKKLDDELSGLEDDYQDKMSRFSQGRKKLEDDLKALHELV